MTRKTEIGWKTEIHMYLHVPSIYIGSTHKLLFGFVWLLFKSKSNMICDFDMNYLLLFPIYSTIHVMSLGHTWFDRPDTWWTVVIHTKGKGKVSKYQKYLQT